MYQFLFILKQFSQSYSKSFRGPVFLKHSVVYMQQGLLWCIICSSIIVQYTQRSTTAIKPMHSEWCCQLNLCHSNVPASTFRFLPFLTSTICPSDLIYYHHCLVKKGINIIHNMTATYFSFHSLRPLSLLLTASFPMPSSPCSPS